LNSIFDIKRLNFKTGKLVVQKKEHKDSKMAARGRKQKVSLL
jgi:hypothetical protein